MNIKESLAVTLVIALGVFLAQGLALGLASALQNAQPQSFGSASDNVLPPAPAAPRVFVNSADTLVAATSTGRQRLELFNAIGATTTAQTVYCNFGDRPAVLYSGMALFATSSKSWDLDNLYRGAIRCIAPASGALITVTDF
jgi:hypothetical protein